MERSGISLRRRPTDDAHLARLAAEHPPFPLVDLPRLRSRRARWGRPPAPHAVAGFTWNLCDRRAPHWWPQGIDVLEADGARPDLLVVSWFSQRGKPSRVTFVEPRPRSPRYWHVSLVAPTADGWEPVTAHAGGVAVVGNRLWIAGTHGGLHEFRLDRMLLLDGRLALPRVARLVPRTVEGAERLRYSFVSLESPHDRLGLVVGEWRPEPGGRLARLAMADAGTEVDLTEIHDPRIPNMQGAFTDDGTWFVTSSDGERAGDLWVGECGSLTRLAGELAPGPEDLTLWRGRLWNVSEYPGRRWVYALDRDDVIRRAARVAAAVR